MALKLHGPLHELPRKEVSFLPKFDGEGNITTLEHIRKYEFVLRLLDITYEDVVCRLFPFTFEGKVSDWYFVLPIHTIHGWFDFKRVFQSAYDIYNATDIYLELDGIQVKEGESIREFNTRFRQVYHRLKDNHKPSSDIIYEWYVHSLPKSIAMFVA